MTDNSDGDEYTDGEEQTGAGAESSSIEESSRDAAAGNDQDGSSGDRSRPASEDGTTETDDEENGQTVPATSEDSGAATSADDGTDSRAESGTDESTDFDGSAEDEPDDRPTAEDLTPDEVDIDRPDKYVFEYVDSELLPPEVQYTPEFDDNWIYPTGAKSGGSRDDVPVQGLELGIVTEVDRLESTVEAILSALETYYRDTGRYPRHRFVSDADSFDRLSDNGVGFVATFQPRPDGYDGLVEHMRAMQTKSGDELVNPNVETAELLAAHLVRALTEYDVPADGITLDGPEDWRQIADTIIFERYAPLASEGLYDPTEGDVDLDDPSAETVAELSFAPTYLDVEETESLLELLDTVSEPDASLSDEASEAEERPRDGHQPTRGDDNAQETTVDRGETPGIDADDDTASQEHNPASQDAADVQEDTGEGMDDATIDRTASDVFAEANERTTDTDQTTENGGTEDDALGEENSDTTGDEPEEDEARIDRE